MFCWSCDLIRVTLQELLMSGLPEIDVEDWKSNTEYTGYNEDNCVVKVIS